MSLIIFIPHLSLTVARSIILSEGVFFPRTGYDRRVSVRPEESACLRPGGFGRCRGCRHQMAERQLEAHKRRARERALGAKRVQYGRCLLCARLHGIIRALLEKRRERVSTILNHDIYDALRMFTVRDGIFNRHIRCA